MLYNCSEIQPIQNFSLRLDVDDQYSNSTKLDSVRDSAAVNGTLYFGSVPEWMTLNVISTPFIGCLGDVTIGGNSLDFGQSTAFTEDVGAVSLVGCTMETLVPTLAPPTDGQSESGARSVGALQDRGSGKVGSLPIISPIIG